MIKAIIGVQLLTTCVMGVEFAQSDDWSIKKKTEANSNNNMNELDHDSDLFNCGFEVHVRDDSFDVIDDPDNNRFGYKLHLTEIKSEHEGCESAVLRLAWTKHRDDGLAKANKFDSCEIADSTGKELKEKRMTLGTVKEINEMAK